ncbi:hypothetical protein [Paenibacillus sp. PCH8]|uniref:hypothetical protein n=1 Tax=Paenibacillus sp. PCH8 TaxID=2066524 RepID=UPI0021579FD6|nr:hypothetical protein [Paenibacillus sp. PCH8]
MLHQQGKSARDIASGLGKQHATLCLELRRNEAQSPIVPSDLRRAMPKGLSTPFLPENGHCSSRSFFGEKLQATWPPEQIVERFRQERHLRSALKPSIAGSI